MTTPDPGQQLPTGWQHVAVPSRGSSPLYLVFPVREARINWLEFRRPPGFGSRGGPPWAPRPGGT